jgi:hypothetical protein
MVVLLCVGGEEDETIIDSNPVMRDIDRASNGNGYSGTD